MAIAIDESKNTDFIQLINEAIKLEIQKLVDRRVSAFLSDLNKDIHARANELAASALTRASIQYRMNPNDPLTTEIIFRMKP